MRSFAALALAALAAGCAEGPGVTAPVEYRAEAPRPASPLPPRPHPAAAPDWADGPGTPLSAFALQPDEDQPVDPRATPPTYVAKPGDSVFTVSQRFQIPMRAIIETNGLDAPFDLPPGSVVRLPPPRLHTVAPGETLLSLARRYAIDARSLALLNRLEKPFAVRVGDVLVLPALARPPQAPPPPAASQPAPPPPQRAKLRKGDPAPLPSGPPPDPAAARGRFDWPVAGRVAEKFGPQDGGKRSDGLEIETAPGAPIRAAAAGRIVYAGDDLPGYGRLILIQHADGWVTAYAHCGAMLATEGAKVARGDKIGETAKDGRLHFQLRKGADPVDPQSALPAR